MFTLYPNLIFLSFVRLFLLSSSQSEFIVNSLDIGFNFVLSVIIYNDVILLSFTGIYMVLVIIIVCSKLCSKCIHQRIKLYANIIIRDNFAALLFGVMIFFTMLKHYDLSYNFFLWGYFLILTLLQNNSKFYNYLISCIVL